MTTADKCPRCGGNKIIAIKKDGQVVAIEQCDLCHRSGEKQAEPKPEVKTSEVLSDIDYDRLVDAFNLSSERGIEVVEELLADRKQSIIAEAIKELPKEKVLQNPPDIDDLGDMRFNMCLSEVKQILERIGGLK